MNLKLPKIELNCLILLKIENWIENCQKINFWFFSLSEKLKIELKIVQNQLSFFWNYWKLSKNEMDVFVHGWKPTSKNKNEFQKKKKNWISKNSFIFQFLFWNWKMKNEKFSKFVLF